MLTWVYNYRYWRYEQKLKEKHETGSEELVKTADRLYDAATKFY